VVSHCYTNAPMLTGATGARTPSPRTHPAPLISAAAACCPVLNIVLPLPSRRNVDCVYREGVSPPVCGQVMGAAENGSAADVRVETAVIARVGGGI
jgi:hypothetical protein